ncbi:MAG: ABC transporter ATP-binding protein [Planctomycetota bacterium]|jgi:ABC-2 type transport system ATP-binding protein
MIEIRRLTKRFGPFTAVDDVEFSVARDKVLGFLGPNGAGKSTTMRMVTGFLPPTSGTALLDGHDILRAPQAARRTFGYLPEGAPAWPDMTPAGLLDFVGRVRRLSAAERRQRLAEAVERVHLEEVLHQPIETLSKGYKRRVGLAQALLHDPDILILDEPTDGLDPNQKHEVRQLIRSMAERKAILLSTHLLEEVEALCTRVVVISSGKLVADGTPAELIERDPRHGAVRLTFSGEVPSGALETVGAKAAAVERPAPNELLALPGERVDLASELHLLAQAESWPLAGLTTERGRLDVVFRDLTHTDAGTAASRANASSTTAAPQEVAP